VTGFGLTGFGFDLFAAGLVTVVAGVSCSCTGASSASSTVGLSMFFFLSFLK
jgi:hypothetical protein